MEDSIRKRFVKESIEASINLKVYNSYIYSGPAILCKDLDGIEDVFSVPVIKTRDFGLWVIHPDEDAEV